MANLKQADRLMQFTSPLGEDVLVLEAFEGTEGISRLFNFRAHVLADVGTQIKPNAIVGTKVSVGIRLSDKVATRWFHGLAAAFEQGNSDVEFDGYGVRIVPSAWQMTLNSNCRVFQDLTVMAIVKKVLGEHSLSLADHTKTSYKPLDYCTQYNESDFSFISRLLEQHGIFYWFEHTENDDKICFGDNRDAYLDAPLSSTLEFGRTSDEREDERVPRLRSFVATSTMVPGKHSTQDYELRGFTTHTQPPQPSTSPFGKNGFEEFFFPVGEEGYVKNKDKRLSDPNHGAIFLGAQASAEDATAEVFQGISNLRSLVTGRTFTLKKHPRNEWNRQYLVTELTHHATQVPSYRSEANLVEGGYDNWLTAIDSTITFKPPSTTPRPRVYGPQTAYVVAPAGEEMFIDKLGRVCLQFFWDRNRKPNTVDNTWVRVAQIWAGNGRGTFFWPRINDEVIVQFLNGDPDNPVVTGSVYNGVNVPKYKLPDMSTRSGLVTRSSKGGGEANANELRFEDKAKSEQIFLNAERDMDHRVEHDHRQFIGGQDSLIVKGAQYSKVEADRHADIKGKAVEKVGGDSDVNITGNLNQKLGENYSLQIGQNHGHKVGQNYALDAGMQVYLKGGTTVVIESGMELCLKGAGGFITIGPAGIAISGTMVMINSGGAPVSGTPPSLQSPGDPTKPDEADDGSKGGAM